MTYVTPSSSDGRKSIGDFLEYIIKVLFQICCEHCSPEKKTARARSFQLSSLISKFYSNDEEHTTNDSFGNRRVRHPIKLFTHKLQIPCIPSADCFFIASKAPRGVPSTDCGLTVLVTRQHHKAQTKWVHRNDKHSIVGHHLPRSMNERQTMSSAPFPPTTAVALLESV